MLKQVTVKAIENGFLYRIDHASINHGTSLKNVKRVKTGTCSLTPIGQEVGKRIVECAEKYLCEPTRREAMAMVFDPRIKNSLAVLLAGKGTDQDEDEWWADGAYRLVQEEYNEIVRHKETEVPDEDEDSEDDDGAVIDEGAFASLGLNLVVEPKQKKRKLNARVETEMDSYRTYKLSIHDYSLHILKNCNAESLKRYKEAIGQDVFEALVMAKMNMSKLNI